MTMAYMIEKMLSWLHHLQQKEFGTDPRFADVTKKMLRDQMTEQRLFAYSVRAPLATVKLTFPIYRIRGNRKPIIREGPFTRTRNTRSHRLVCSMTPNKISRTITNCAPRDF